MLPFFARVWINLHFKLNIQLIVVGPFDIHIQWSPTKGIEECRLAQFQGKALERSPILTDFLLRRGESDFYFG